jgi:tetratricopeptide (TPR) repeat protein
MTNRLAEADAALKAGRRDDAIDLIVETLNSDPSQSLQCYRVLVLQLYQAGRHEEGAVWSGKAVERFPKDFDLWNTHGVILRRLKRYPEALKALDQAQKLNPKSLAPAINRGNVLTDSGAYPAAEAVFAKLARLEPRNAEYQRGLGRALLKQKKYEPAVVRLKQAVNLRKDYLDAWLDLSSAEGERHRHEDGLAVLDRALEAMPGDAKLLEAKAMMLRRSGRLREAAEFVRALLPARDEGWVHFQLAAALGEYDRETANVHYRRAVDLDPTNIEYIVALAESLDRSRHGDEGANIEAGHDVIQTALAIREPESGAYRKIAHEILQRVGDYEQADRIGEFENMGREWATTGRHTALLKHLPRVRRPEDRVELINQHRLWGKLSEEAAQRTPIRRPAGSRPGSKIRLGFMSSDLRAHPVAYFTLPLFEHIDHERFEIFCYSFFQGDKADGTQKRIESLVDCFRWKRDLADRDAAQMIADDQLDMLIELGGSTHMNKLEVMAYKPARLSASWLGYPHSTGLSTVDYLIVDPHLNPPRRELLIEKPLLMPHSWIAMSKWAFPESNGINPTPPFRRTGMITFGTANNPYKYSREMLMVWARAVASVPGSRFLFIRPESGAPSFRKNMRAIFAAEGVSEDRVLFNAVRGIHMPFYNDIDIALDTFPQTGGTTTCETLWMGVPTITIKGEALFERLSYSILVNASLGDLCVDTEDELVAAAVRLAGDPDRLTDIRVNQRERMKAGPLGRTEDFARDFYDMIAGAVQARQGARQSA